jgi:hypothetical protein
MFMAKSAHGVKLYDIQSILLSQLIKAPDELSRERETPLVDFSLVDFL